jgi:hypothetical protein
MVLPGFAATPANCCFLIQVISVSLFSSFMNSEHPNVFKAVRIASGLSDIDFGYLIGVGRNHV